VNATIESDWEIGDWELIRNWQKEDEIAAAAIDEVRDLFWQREEHGGERSLLASDLCLFRCVRRERPAMVNQPMRPSPGLRKYFLCAEDCSSQHEALEIGEEALARLRKCGVVTLKNVFDEAMIRDLQHAWDTFRRNGEYGGTKLADVETKA
jgi:hypothetical protein